MRINVASFVPPAPTRPSPPPAVGGPAPGLDGVDLAGGRPHIVAFLRHTGCPFAEATMRAARELAEQPDVGVIAVVHAGDAATARWCGVVGGAGAVRIVVDEPRKLYARWGLGRSSFRHFAGPSSLAAALRLLRLGIRNTRADGTRWQTAGTFAVAGDGRVAWRHLPRHAGDLPDLGSALRAVHERGSRSAVTAP